MTKSRKNELLRLINIELGKAEISTEKTSADVKTFGKYSWSESGDKYHSESAAELAQEFLANLRKLCEEVESVNDEKSDSASPVSYIEISYDSGETAKFYLVNKNALLPGILLITPNSPIGKAVIGKKEKDGFSYEIISAAKKKVFSGKILKIE